ncbi:carbohydrate kinase family protein [Patescibacteria group bacterium]|nr:carbohydrate kinase family protein [Patescibacteria group bacterium]
MKYDIITIGGAMRDIFFYTKEGKIIETPKDRLCDSIIGFEVGSKAYIDKVYFQGGGGANNTAAGFASMGIKTGIIARVGDDKEGESLLLEMNKRKISTDLMQIDKKNSTGFSFILGLTRKRKHVIFAYRGASDYFVFPFNSYKSLKASWFYISSLSCVDWPVAMKNIFKVIKASKTLVGWNPTNVQISSGYNGLKKFLQMTDVFVLNEDEARELVLSRKKIKDLNVRSLIKEIYDMGPKIVVITVGPRGAYAYNGQKIFYQMEMPAKVINATGAGDSFSSGFIGSLFYHPGDISNALRWGVANSTSVIKKTGAQIGLLNKRQINKYPDI